MVPGVRSACCVNSASGVRVLMPGEFGWGGRDSVLTVERVGPKAAVHFFRNFFPDDGDGRGGGLLMRCVFRLALIAFPDAMVIECTRWLVNDAHDALRFLCRYKGKTKKRDRKECKCQKCKNKSVGYKNVNSVM